MSICFTQGPSNRSTHLKSRDETPLSEYTCIDEKKKKRDLVTVFLDFVNFPTHRPTKNDKPPYFHDHHKENERKIPFLIRNNTVVP